MRIGGNYPFTRHAATLAPLLRQRAFPIVDERINMDKSLWRNTNWSLSDFAYIAQSAEHVPQKGRGCRAKEERKCIA